MGESHCVCVTVITRMEWVTLKELEGGVFITIPRRSDNKVGPRASSMFIPDQIGGASGGRYVSFLESLWVRSHAELKRKHWWVLASYLTVISTK